jgi:hypothetical protein
MARCCPRRLFSGRDAAMDPTSPLAMRDNRYPIAEIGIYNLWAPGRGRRRDAASEVKFFPGGSTSGVYLHRVVHPKARRLPLPHGQDSSTTSGTSRSATSRTTRRDGA